MVWTAGAVTMFMPRASQRDCPAGGTSSGSAAPAAGFRPCSASRGAEFLPFGHARGGGRLAGRLRDPHIMTASRHAAPGLRRRPPAGAGNGRKSAPSGL